MKPEINGGKMRIKYRTTSTKNPKPNIFLLFFFAFCFLHFCLLRADNVFELEYDLNPFLYPTTGEWINELTPRSLQITPDSGYAVLMEIELTDGILEHYCTALLKTDSEGTIQWFEMLTNDPTLNDFEIMMQGWFFARGFTVTNDGGFVVPVTAIGMGNDVGSFILKLNENGDYQWHTQLSDETTEFNNIFNTIKQTQFGEFYAAGYQTESGSNEIMKVVKLSVQGDTLWTRTYQDSLIYKNAYDIEIDTDENPILVGHLKDLGMNWNSFVLKINHTGDIIWINVMEEANSYRNIAYSIFKNINSTFALLGSIIYINNERKLFKKIIDSNGIEISHWDINYTLNQYFVIPSIVTNEINCSFFTARLDNGLEITKLDEYNNILRQREIMGKLGNGPEILQKDENNFFIVISVHNDDTLVITKMDENGNSTDIDGNLISFQKQYFNVYPNPFNPETKIAFSIPDDIKVNLTIYNIKGQKVKTIVDTKLEKGIHEVIWNGRNEHNKPVASGVYFYKLRVNGRDYSIKKCLMLK